MCASQCARARGQRPAFGGKGFPHSPPLRHGKRQCRGNLRAAAACLPKSIAFSAIVLQKELQVRVLAVGHDDQAAPVFFFNLHRVRSNWKSTGASDDKFAQAFGTIKPRHIPESSACWKAVLVCLFLQTLIVCLSSKSLSDWWLQRAVASERGAKVQSRELAAICDDAESGLPHRAYATSQSLCAHL